MLAALRETMIPVSGFPFVPRTDGLCPDVLAVGLGGPLWGQQGLPLPPCISLPRGSSGGASPLLPALVGSAPLLQIGCMQRGAGVMLMHVSGNFALSVRCGCKYRNEGDSNEI